MPKYIDVDSLQFPNICIFDMKLHGTTVPMIRLVDLQTLIPAADVVPMKHGSWICEEQWKRKSVYKCSECNNFFTIRDDTLNGGRGNMNYCPNCGTRMDLPDKIYETNGWWYE